MTSTAVLPAIRFRDPSLAPIWYKVQGGQRLGIEDGLACLQTKDLLSLGQMADYVKRKLWGDKVYFVFNRQINPTNICVLSCAFCDFSRKKGEAGAYEMGMDEILARLDPEMKEVHIVGGHHPDWPFERYEGIIRSIHQAFPGIHIKAWTASEIDYFCKRFRMTVEEVLTRMKDAGLVSMTGGGAEVFSERVRKELFSGKNSAQRWLEIHRIAHLMGIPSNATLLYGHIETYEERVQHMALLRELEDEAPGFLAFIPLEYQVGNTRLVSRQASAMDDLRTIATSRLMLDNFPHVKAYWVMVGEETASIALNFGASDLDGTIGEERIAHAARATSPVGLARTRMLRLIRDAGKTPVERDALYHEVHVYET
ncbi:MAG: aminofutalosine synthase MqnE [Chloroflexi bacterium]|nr:aminofutalosine synthase MqnE [Chloroflexota bacterium]